MDPRVSLSDQLPGAADAASPWITLYVARVESSPSAYHSTKTDSLAGKRSKDAVQAKIFLAISFHFIQHLESLDRDQGKENVSLFWKNQKLR